jgi:hypothetical protein
MSFLSDVINEVKRIAGELEGDAEVDVRGALTELAGQLDAAGAEIEADVTADLPEVKALAAQLIAEVRAAIEKLISRIPGA